jgi:ribonuclease P protein component
MAFRPSRRYKWPSTPQYGGVGVSVAGVGALTLCPGPCISPAFEFAMNKEDDRETDVSAEPPRAQAPPRLPRPHGHQGRAKGSEPPPGQGPQEAQRLILRQRGGLFRLTRRGEYLRVNQGHRAATATLVALANARADGGPARIGFTCTKKIGNAVIRNRVRRRLKEAARVHFPALSRPGADYVLIARETTAEAPWACLLDDVKTALVRLAQRLDGGPAPPRKPKRG